MKQEWIPLSRDMIYSCLQECSKKKDLAACRRVHSLMIKSKLDSIAVLGDHLIRLFAYCGSLLDANHVFCSISKPTVYTWNGIISAHSKLGEGKKAVELYNRMQQVGIKPDKVTFLCILKACRDTDNIGQGRVIHGQIIISGLHLDVVVGSTLIDMYSKCGSLEDACRVFNQLPSLDVVSWGAIIAGQIQHGDSHSALMLFEKMQKEGIKPSNVIFLLSLKACGSIESIRLTRLIHGQMTRTVLDLDTVLGSTLVDMYCKCASIDEACVVFEKLQHRDLVSWSVMISGCAQHGHGYAALELYEGMLKGNSKPDKVIFLCVLQACASIGVMEHGRLMHDQIIRHGFESDTAIRNTLVDMYAKCGNLDQAHKLFEELPHRDVVSWGVMISSYAQHGQALSALDLFAKMQQRGIKPTKFTLSCILKACGSIGSLEQGRLVHGQIIQNGFHNDIIVGNTLVYMYAQCSSLNEAQSIFDRLPSQDMVSWGVMIAGYVEQGHGRPGLELFERMQLEGKKLDKAIFLCTLKACSNMAALGQGRLIHQLIVNKGLEFDQVVGSTLVDMYAKCGSLGEALSVFQTSIYQDVVLWGALIAGYTEDGQPALAFELFEKMQQVGMKPDQVMLICIFRACGSIGALGKGRLIHSQIMGTKHELDVVIGSTLIDMYIKCGSLEEAVEVFNKLLNRDMVAWGTMISGYALYGKASLASQCLWDMQQEGLMPDGETFTGILAACSHIGLLKEGCWYFKSMRENFGIMPNIEHYDCIVDLLGRAGHVKEAADLLQTMPVAADVIGWTSLLASCRTYGNMEFGRVCFDQVVQLDPEDASEYVLMSNIYANASMWEEVDRMQVLKKSAGVFKKPGQAWIEVNNMVHEFIVQGRVQPPSDEFYTKLKRLNTQLKQGGHMPQSDLVLEPNIM